MRLLPRTAGDLRGRCEIIPADPAVEEVERVYATPHVEDGPWGVFRADGAPVALAVERGGDPLAPLRQVPEPTVPFAAAEPAPPGEYVYGGRYVHHFGHFIVETLARLWPWAERGLPPGARLVMHGDGSPASWWAVAYVRAALGALGITPERILHVDRPLRFERLLVPGSAFLPGAAAHPAFARLTRRIGERIAPDAGRTPRDHRPAFFAKTRLIGGVSHLQNEPEIVAALAARGVEIVHPQHMGLADHVRFLASRRVVSGWVSSAHHVSAFAPERACRFSMLAPPLLNSNFFLIDRLTRAKADYWFAEGTRNVPAPGSTFIVERVAPDPVAVAQALLERF